MPAFPRFSDPPEEVEIKRLIYRREHFCGVPIFVLEGMEPPDVMKKLLGGYKP